MRHALGEWPGTVDRGAAFIAASVLRPIPISRDVARRFEEIRTLKRKFAEITQSLAGSLFIGENTVPQHRLR